MLPELVNTANEKNSFNVQELTTVRTICYMIYETSIDKMMFFEVYSRTYFFNLTLTKKLPKKYYNTRMTKPCYAVTYT